MVVVCISISFVVIATEGTRENHRFQWVDAHTWAAQPLTRPRVPLT